MRIMNNLLGLKIVTTPVSEGFGFQDKRNRNPNWTDQEIMRFLEILQEEDTMKDLMAQRNKQVFCYVAQRMCSEGADKTWDQCRIKLKNLKSQYRYVKERVPNLDRLDLENEAVVKQLIQDCQGRGISSSSIKHLKYLRRFMNKQGIMVGSGISGSENSSFSTSDDLDDKEEPVSPPTSPKLNGISIISDTADEESRPKRHKLNDPDLSAVQKEIQNGYRFIERFNRDMMEQFMEQQRKSQSNFLRWEQERFRMEQQAMERWRQEARDHEKQLFGMFCHVMTQCNSALNTILKAAQTVASSSATQDDENDD